MRPSGNPRQRPDRIFLLSPSGWGNEGDNAILSALVRQVCDVIPEGSVVLATLSPTDSARIIRRPAVPLRGVSRQGYHIRGARPARPGPREPGPVTPGAGDSPPPDPGWKSALRRMFPERLLSLGAQVVRFPVRLAEEAVFFRRLLSWLRRGRVVLVAGGGQFDELWGGPFGHPLTLLQWSLAARLAGIPLSVISVGAGEIRHPATRAFVRWALLGARHVSVRDPRTGRLVRELLGTSVRESPDLAFLLSGGTLGEVHPAASPPATTGEAVGLEGKVIAISPMAYGRPGIWPEEDIDTFRRMCAAMAEAGSQWVREGAELVFFVTSRMDTVTAREVMDAVRAEVPSGAGRVRFQEANSPDEVLSVLGDADIAVVARLHGVILGLVAGVPTVAVSHHWKVREQMALAGQEDLVFEPSEVEGADLVSAVSSLQPRLDEVRRGIGAYALASRDRVVEDVRRALDR